MPSPWEQGRRAYVAGKPRLVNPHTGDAAEYWTRGYLEAQAAAGGRAVDVDAWLAAAPSGEWTGWRVRSRRQGGRISRQTSRFGPRPRARVGEAT